MFLAAVNIGDSLQTGLDAFFGFIPRLIGFLLVLFIGYIVARIVKGVLVKVLDKVGIDHALHSGSTGHYVNKVAPDVKPSRVIGALAFWFIFLGAVSIAVSQLGHPGPDDVRRRHRRLPAQRDRRGPDLRGRRRDRRRRRRARRPHDGRHPDRQGRRLCRAGAGHGDRDVHDPQPAPDRAGDRHDHLRRADRRRVPRHGARLRPRRPRGRRPDARRGLRHAVASSKDTVKRDAQIGKERGKRDAERAADEARAPGNERRRRRTAPPLGA